MNPPDSTGEPPQFVTLRQASGYWLKLGFISFGGPAGQIAIMPTIWSKSNAGFPRGVICMS
ncbi:hypothetical protein [Methylomicrobium agile]|uniref:hypothetical protein n=1 Tax=Methylomicrobium agile TaxID=39774 RepID=UPI00068B63DA